MDSKCRNLSNSDLQIIWKKYGSFRNREKLQYKKTAESVWLNLFKRTNGKINNSHAPSTGLSRILLSIRIQYSWRTIILKISTLLMYDDNQTLFLTINMYLLKNATFSYDSYLEMTLLSLAAHSSTLLHSMSCDLSNKILF